MKGPVSAPPVEVQFAQKLAANDKKDRDRAVKKLKKWFGARSSGFPQEELMRIWKGLFYCYWMSDKPLVQEELAENISSMVGSFQTTQDGLGFVQAFAKTFQREWFGVDRWRMDKTMMFVRRFLRHSLKLVAKAEWEETLLEAFIEVVRKEVVLTDPANASLGFQLHFTDVFLEEVAKVGGEDLPSKVVGKLVQPWVELVATSTDLRLIEHTEERIFNHLLRQSDPGIKYQMEEDGLEEEEDEEKVSEANGAENGSIANGHENGHANGHENGDGESDGEEEDEENNDEEESAEDPRAGRVSVVIPQVAVDYPGIAENLFQLGSKENMRKSNRDMLYRVSKKFKDVAANIFPLGPNLEELEAIEIPKISVKKSAAELAKRQAQIRKENLESKKQAKKATKLKEEEAPAEETNGKADSEDEVSDEDIKDDEDDSLKRKAGNSDEEKEDEEEDEPTGKKVKRENQKKKKQERKRKKREAQLKAALEKAEQEKKVENQLGHDLEINSALVKKNEGRKDKKRKHDVPVTNGHSSPVKKAKVETTQSNGEVKVDKAMDINQNVPEQAKKKKKKKSKQKPELANGNEANEVVEKVEEKELNGLKEKSSPVPELGKLPGKTISEIDSLVGASSVESNVKQVQVGEVGQVSDADKKLKKKKKKSKKEMHRIDSDISFSAPSLSQTNLSIAEKPTPAPMTPIAEAETPTPATINPEAESPKSTPLESKASPSEDTPRLKKKKMKKSKGMASLQEGTPNKVFEEPTWDSPLLPGEQELVLPNKNYKGPEKLAPPAAAPEISGFEPSQITPVKSFTSTFLKKAVSKSGTPKKSKKDRLLEESAKKELSNSAPQKKRINFALTQNKAQDFVEHLRQVKSSPQTPHDPDKKPTKKLLKKKESLESSAKKLNPVGLNTQLNSRSKTAKILQKRARAMDFF